MELINCNSSPVVWPGRLTGNVARDFRRGQHLNILTGREKAGLSVRHRDHGGEIAAVASRQNLWHVATVSDAESDHGFLVVFARARHVRSRSEWGSSPAAAGSAAAIVGSRAIKRIHGAQASPLGRLYPGVVVLSVG